MLILFKIALPFPSFQRGAIWQMEQISQRHFISNKVLLRCEYLVIDGEHGVEVYFGFGDSVEVGRADVEFPDCGGGG